MGRDASRDSRSHALLLRQDRGRGRAGAGRGGVTLAWAVPGGPAAPAPGAPAPPSPGCAHGHARRVGFSSLVAGRSPPPPVSVSGACNCPSISLSRPTTETREHGHQAPPANSSRKFNPTTASQVDRNGPRVPASAARWGEDHVPWSPRALVTRAPWSPACPDPGQCTCCRRRLGPGAQRPEPGLPTRGFWVSPPDAAASPSLQADVWLAADGRPEVAMATRRGDPPTVSSATSCRSQASGARQARTPRSGHIRGTAVPQAALLGAVIGVPGRVTPSSAASSRSRAASGSAGSQTPAKARQRRAVRDVADRGNRVRAGPRRRPRAGAGQRP